MTGCPLPAILLCGPHRPGMACPVLVPGKREGVAMFFQLWSPRKLRFTLHCHPTPLLQSADLHWLPSQIRKLFE